MSCVPAVVVAAPASGSGKTTLATGLIGALRRAGRRVAPFKVGPDFIDPGYHGLAADRPGRNLDPVLVGEDLIGPLYRHGSYGADIAVIEGVMGLFDGRIDEHLLTPARGSTAQVAALLGVPVLLVVDGRGQSQSIGAVVQGFSTFHPDVRLAGVILNRVGSARHERVLRQACEGVGVPVLGSVPRHDALSVPSRHLGLVTAAEHGDRARAAVEAMADLVGRHVDVEAVAALAAATVPAAAWSPEATMGPVSPEATIGAGSAVSRGRPVVAVAAGSAFTFGYAERDELLHAAGAQIVYFDPISDTLPDGTAALLLPGGFPEQYAAELAANDPLRQQIAALADGAPVYAECGGLTYLMSDLDGHRMCGVLPGSATFTERLTLGYRDAVAATDSAVFQAGQRVTGHEFHRTAVRFRETVQPAWLYSVDADRSAAPGQDGPRRAVRVQEGAVQGGVHASYLHVHPAAHPQAVRRLVAGAEVLGLPG